MIKTIYLELFLFELVHWCSMPCTSWNLTRQRSTSPRYILLLALFIHRQLKWNCLIICLEYSDYFLSFFPFCMPLQCIPIFILLLLFCCIMFIPCYRILWCPVNIFKILYGWWLIYLRSSFSCNLNQRKLDRNRSLWVPPQNLIGKMTVITFWRKRIQQVMSSKPFWLNPNSCSAASNNLMYGG